MKLAYKSFLFLALALGATACSEVQDPVYNVNSASAPALQEIGDSYTLQEGNEDFATFSFSKADFGIQVAVQYLLEASLSEDFATVKEVMAGAYPEGGFVLPASTLNSALIGMDAVPESPATVYFRVRAVVNNLSSKPTTMVLVSNVISTQVTPYSTVKEYPKVWVIGDYCGWNHGATQFLYSYAENTTYTGVVDFGEKAAAGFKITGVGSWDDSTMNWGLDGNAAAPEAEAGSIQLIADGGSGNIGCYSHRFYRFSLDTSSLLLTKDLAFDTFSIVGEAGSQVNGWGKQDVEMQFDPATQRFYADVEFTDGEIKFYADKDWGVSFGSATAGILDSADNISVSAGKYRVYVNLNNPSEMTYELSTKDFGK